MYSITKVNEISINKLYDRGNLKLSHHATSDILVYIFTFIIESSRTTHCSL
jgi:hypothetical protein